MKKLALLLSLTCFVIFAHAQKQHLTLNPAQPKKGEKIRFAYDPKGTPLENKANVDISVYHFNRNEDATGQTVKLKEIKLTKDGEIYRGEIQPDENTSVLMFRIESDNVKDANFGNGYITVINGADNKPLPGAYAALNMIYDGYGKYTADVEMNADKAYQYAEKSWTEFPNERLKNMNSYISALMQKKKADATPEVKTILANYENDPKMEEVHYQIMARFYTRIKEKEKADALLAKMKDKFPNGNWKKSEAANKVYTSKTAKEKEDALNNYLSQFPPSTEQERSQVNYMYSTIATAYGADNDTRDATKFKEYADKLPMDMKASLYNNVSWNWALKDMELNTAAEISKVATLYAKTEVQSPTAKKSEMITTKDWDKSRRNTYGMYADTYGFILYKAGKYAEAYPFIKEAAIDINGGKNAEYNERYALILEKVETPEKVKAALEPMVREGNSNTKIKEILRNAYIKSNPSGDVNAFMASAEKEAEAKKMEEVRKLMMKYEAAGFVLKNTEGVPVSLASLKGKVVIVDFWATWCGPCKASFPAMQKMVEKYKDDKNVAFVFVDTWESGDDRLKNVKQFITDNKYSFHVLMDDPKKDDPDQFTVVSNYKVDGIPTKFVIDPNGNVRFKSVGWQGSADGLMTELSSMIELAKNNK